MILKCLIIFISNVIFGWLLGKILFFYLFYPRKVYIFPKKSLIFTPGLFFRYKEKLISFLHRILKEYIECTNMDYRSVNFLTDFEKKIFKEVYPFMQKLFRKSLMPEFFRYRINGVLTNILWKLIRYLSRNLLPRLILQLQVEHKIDILDLKLDIYQVRRLFRDNILNYIQLFNICLFSIVGLLNILLFIVLN